MRLSGGLSGVAGIAGGVGRERLRETGPLFFCYQGYGPHHFNGEYSAGTKNSDTTPFSFTVSEPPAVSSEAYFAASQSGSALNPAKLSLAASWLLWARR